MKEKLIHSNKIQIQKSPLHGYGVFATSNIKSGTTLEEVPFLEINKKSSTTSNYTFKAKEYPYGVLPGGFSWLYNSSRSREEANATYRHDTENNIFIFESIKEIPKGKELLVFYGEAWWTKSRIKAMQSTVTIDIENRLARIHKLNY